MKFPTSSPLSDLLCAALFDYVFSDIFSLFSIPSDSLTPDLPVKLSV